MTAAQTRMHFAYTTWATRKILDAVRALPPGLLEEPNGSACGSMLAILAHIAWADQVWYTRVVGPWPKPSGAWPQIETDWLALLAAWQVWAASLSDADSDRVIQYAAFDGSPFEQPLWQIVLHVVNHATLHRGQIMQSIRQAGIAPPHTDLIHYVREKAGA